MPKPTPSLHTGEVGTNHSRRRRHREEDLHVASPDALLVIEPTPSVLHVEVVTEPIRTASDADRAPDLVMVPEAALEAEGEVSTFTKTDALLGVSPGIDDFVGKTVDGVIPSDEVGRDAEPESGTAVIGTDDPLLPATDGSAAGSVECAINRGAESRGYEFVNPPDPPSATEVEAVSVLLLSTLDEAASNATVWAGVTSPGLGTQKLRMLCVQRWNGIPSSLMYCDRTSDASARNGLFPPIIFVGSGKSIGNQLRIRVDFFTGKS
jgi:hypothetical protein